MKKVQLPNAENSCAEGKRLYGEFFDLKNQGATVDTLEAVGDSAMEYLYLCYYSAMSPQVGEKSREQASEIAAVLYPPPPPPSQTPTYTECEEGSQNPGWFSGFDLGKVAVLQALTRDNTLKVATFAPIMRDTTIYYRDVKTKMDTLPRIMFRHSIQP